MQDVWRLFAAVELPQDVRDQAAAIIADLRRDGWQARWAKPESMHLTMRFYGDVPMTQVSALSDAVASAARQVGAFALRTGRLGVFPNSRSPRVVWIGLDGNTAALNRLYEEIEAASEALGFAREARGFSPHITLGRLRPEDVATQARVDQQLQEHAPRDSRPVPVERVVLYRSELLPSGALHTPLDVFPLEAGGR